MGEFVLNKLKESIENKLKMIFSVFSTQYSIVPTFHVDSTNQLPSKDQ